MSDDATHHVRMQDASVVWSGRAGYGRESADAAGGTGGVWRGFAGARAVRV